jgi:translocation and assembly module TamA
LNARLRLRPWWRARAAEGIRAALLVILVSGCAQLESWTGLGSDDDESMDTDALGSEPINGGPTVPYEVAFEGQLPGDLQSLLEAVSDAAQRVDRPPSSITVLRRRAQEDVPRLQQALRSEGYYAGTIDVRVDPDVEPARVVFDVDAGPRYRFRQLIIEVRPPTAPFTVPSVEALGLKVDEPARAQLILDAEAALLAAAKRQGFALAKIGQRQAIVDHDARIMDLTLRLDLGPLTRFGATKITGLRQVDEEFVERRIRWQEGEVITPERLDATREEIVDSGLFTAVRITLADTAGPEGEVPVTIQLAERKHRSIGVGARYRTDEGLGGNISWEHRNLFGAGERLSADIDVSPINQNLSVEFRKPDVLRTDQALVASAELANETPDAYDSRSIGASVGFQRRLGERKEAGVSLAYRFADIEQEGSRERFALLSLPAYLNWDASNDLLNPTQGWRGNIINTPFVDTLGFDLTFNRSRIDYAHYLAVLDDPGIILAGRTALGAMFGADLFSIPADERFYAGGGGSVRGWGYQRAGQLDAEDNPVGGRSLFEASGEIRAQATETLGGVVFVDAGAAYPETFPTFDQLFVGTGFGLRYFTPVGPLRADIGFPIDPRPSDDLFQIYISLGQAF